jgi:uncharacterized membrane protein YfcA
MFLGSAPMSLLGVALSSRLLGDGPSTGSNIVLGTAFLVGGAGLVLKNAVGGTVKVRDPFVLTPRDRVAALVIGAFGGFVVGLTSVGSGVFFGLTLLVAFPLGASKIVGTDLLHAAGLLWVAGVGHLVAGNVDLHAVAWLLLGSIPGVLAGSEWSVRVRASVLRSALAAVLVLSGLKLAAPGLWFPCLAGVSVLGALAAVGTIRRRGATRAAVRVGAVEH